MTRRRFKLNAGRWAYVRRLALERDHYTCRECGRGGRSDEPSNPDWLLERIPNLNGQVVASHMMNAILFYTLRTVCAC